MYIVLIVVYCSYHVTENTKPLKIINFDMTLNEYEIYIKL